MNKCEPDPLMALPDPTLPNTDFRIISTLSDLCDRELVATIGWAKQIPGDFFLYSFVELMSKTNSRVTQICYAVIKAL